MFTVLKCECFYIEGNSTSAKKHDYGVVGAEEDKGLMWEGGGIGSLCDRVSFLSSEHLSSEMPFRQEESVQCFGEGTGKVGAGTNTLGTLGQQL